MYIGRCGMQRKGCGHRGRGVATEEGVWPQRKGCSVHRKVWHAEEGVCIGRCGHRGRGVYRKVWPQRKGCGVQRKGCGCEFVKELDDGLISPTHIR